MFIILCLLHYFVVSHIKLVICLNITLWNPYYIPYQAKVEGQRVFMVYDKDFTMHYSIFQCSCILWLVLCTDNFFLLMPLFTNFLLICWIYFQNTEVSKCHHEHASFAHRSDRYVCVLFFCTGWYDVLSCLFFIFLFCWHNFLWSIISKLQIDSTKRFSQ